MLILYYILQSFDRGILYTIVCNIVFIYSILDTIFYTLVNALTVIKSILLVYIIYYFIPDIQTVNL